MKSFNEFIADKEAELSEMFSKLNGEQDADMDILLNKITTIINCVKKFCHNLQILYISLYNKYSKTVIKPFNITECLFSLYKYGSFTVSP